MMRSVVAVAVFFALAIAVSAFSVSTQDKICSVDSDCTVIKVNCSDVCGCSYDAVNTTQLSLNQAAFIKSCPVSNGTRCMVVCMAPEFPTCVNSTTTVVASSSGSVYLGICSFPPLIIIAPSTCEIRSSCSGIADICVPFSSPIMDCAAPMVGFVSAPTCQDICLSKAQCTYNGMGCSFVNSAVIQTDGITYDVCVHNCAATPPINPLPVTCVASSICNAVVKNMCRSSNSPMPMVMCTNPDVPYVESCEDKCLVKAQCAPIAAEINSTFLSCSFQDSVSLPVDGISYDQCVKSCYTPIITGCDHGSAPAVCLIDPCEGKRCDSNPNAVCTANFCNGCLSYSFSIGGVSVTCDPIESPCSSLSCGNCLSKTNCTYCSGTHASFCGSKTWLNADLCIAKTSGTITASSSICPLHTDSALPPKTVVTDTNDFQSEVDGSTEPVTTKFTVVITLAVKTSDDSNSTGVNVLSIFVDFIGAGVPTQADKDQVCGILKASAIKHDINIPAQKLTCAFVTTTKRSAQDSSQFAKLSYPASASNVQSSAPSAGITLSAFVAAVILSLA